MYLEPWHSDVFDFLELKKNTGKEEQRARDLFFALWIPDLFMKRVESNQVNTEGNAEGTLHSIINSSSAVYINIPLFLDALKSRTVRYDLSVVWIDTKSKSCETQPACTQTV